MYHTIVRANWKSAARPGRESAQLLHRAKATQRLQGCHRLRSRCLASVASGIDLVSDVRSAAIHAPRISLSRTDLRRRRLPHRSASLRRCRQAVAEMARVSNRLVAIEDTLFLSEQRRRRRGCAIPRTCAPTAKRNGRSSVEAGLEVEQVEFFEKIDPLAAWLARTGCEGDEAARVKELLRPQLVDGGCLATTRRSCSRHESRNPDGGHRRQEHAARRPGAYRQRGPVPRATQPELRHERRRGRHSGQGRARRRGHPGVQHGRGSRLRCRTRTRR